MRILLISTYDLGRQPFGLASPAAWLREAGFEVTCRDLAVESLAGAGVEDADLVAVHLPMHTATRIALPLLDRIRDLAPAAHLCAYGLYAPMNAGLLRERGVGTILGGEFEEGLLSLARRLEKGRHAGGGQPAQEAAEAGPDTAWTASGPPAAQPEPEISLARQRFRVPDRSDLPALSRYARLQEPGGRRRVVGATEASRGCKHLCRHCPIVPVYEGRFRIVAPDVVLEDVRRQVAAGAEHVTFGDPDFFNGPRHAERIVTALHDEHPGLTYDVTIKVEHLLRHADLLPVLRDTGCALVTSAVESLDDRVLEILDKGHTRRDFVDVVERFREVGLPLQPTFVAFTPWIDRAGYADLLRTLADLDLVESVPSIQLAIRLLIPAGSRLLERPEVEEVVGAFDPAALTWRWEHPDPRMDELQRRVEALVEAAGQAAEESDGAGAAGDGSVRDAALAAGSGGGARAATVDGAGAATASHVHADRRTVFTRVCALAAELSGSAIELPPVPPGRPRATIPYLTEPWYC